MDERRKDKVSIWIWDGIRIGERKGNYGIGMG